MKIKLICVGKLKEAYLRAGIAEYEKRLGRSVDIIELADERIPERPSDKEIEAVKNREGARILAAIRPRERVVLLAVAGELMTSEALAAYLADGAAYGLSAVAFVIGGSLGTSAAVNARADLALSFGRLTLPHQLMRLVLMEQIYRVTMIQRGSTYHK